MTMTEAYFQDWEDRDRLTPWWDPDDIVDLRDSDENPRHDRDDDGDSAPDRGPWDLAG